MYIIKYVHNNIVNIMYNDIVDVFVTKVQCCDLILQRITDCVW